jgi:hypothetical protein
VEEDSIETSAIKIHVAMKQQPPSFMPTDDFISKKSQKYLVMKELEIFFLIRSETIKLLI